MEALDQLPKSGWHDACIRARASSACTPTPRSRPPSGSRPRRTSSPRPGSGLQDQFPRPPYLPWRELDKRWRRNLPEADWQARGAPGESAWEVSLIAHPRQRCGNRPSGDGSLRLRVATRDQAGRGAPLADLDHGIRAGGPPVLTLEQVTATNEDARPRVTALARGGLEEVPGGDPPPFYWVAWIR